MAIQAAVCPNLLSDKKQTVLLGMVVLTVAKAILRRTGYCSKGRRLEKFIFSVFLPPARRL